MVAFNLSLPAFALLFTSILSITAAEDGPQQCKTVTTVTDFDIETYASAPWYPHQQAEISYQPVSQNYCVSAEYSIRPTPSFWGYTVNVDNQAQDEFGNEFGGPLCAYQTAELSKLAVSPCFLPKAVAGPYWVVAYNESEGYALISGGQPTEPSPNGGFDAGCRSGTGINNSGLWIFTRSQTRDDELIDTVRGIAQDAGFDLEVLNDVVQTGCGGADSSSASPTASPTIRSASPTMGSASPTISSQSPTMTSASPTSSGVPSASALPSSESPSFEPSPSPVACSDSEDEFTVWFGGKRDCDWVDGFLTSWRCALYRDFCPETCGNC